MKIVNGTTITTFLGDSFSVTFTDLIPGDKIAFGVRDKKYGKPVFDDLVEIVDENGEVTFEISKEMSNKFVKRQEEYCSAYFYGIAKIDDKTGEKDTILLGDEPKPEDRYVLRVFRKKAEG